MGGNIFKGKTQGIKKEHIEPTVERYLSELQRVFPGKKSVFNKKYFKYIGSVGKKAVSGDIDFAIDISTIIDKNFSDEGIKKWGIEPQAVRDTFQKLKKRARTATDSDLMMKSLLTLIVLKINTEATNIHCDEKKISNGNIFGLFPQFDEKGTQLDYGVQMDWMVGNLQWLEFSYYSEVYTDNVKGLHRTQLMLSMFTNLGLTFNHVTGVKDKASGEVLATDPKRAVEILETRYGVKLSKSTMANYHSLITVVNKLSKADRDNIIAIYFKILDSTRADIPSDLQKEWKARKSELGLTGKFLPPESKLNETFRNYLNELDENRRDLTGLENTKELRNEINRLKKLALRQSDDLQRQTLEQIKWLEAKLKNNF